MQIETVHTFYPTFVTLYLIPPSCLASLAREISEEIIFNSTTESKFIHENERAGIIDLIKVFKTEKKG